MSAKIREHLISTLKENSHKLPFKKFGNGYYVNIPTHLVNQLKFKGRKYVRVFFVEGDNFES